MEKIYKDGEVLEAADLNASFAELETKMRQLIEEYTKDPYIYVDGVKRPLAGMINAQGVRFSSSGGVYYASLRIPEPYTPPEGWRFEFFCGQSSGYTIISTAQPRSVSEYTVRAIQFAENSSNALKKIGWRLVPESTDPNRLANQ